MCIKFSHYKSRYFSNTFGYIVFTVDECLLLAILTSLIYHNIMMELSPFHLNHLFLVCVNTGFGRPDSTPSLISVHVCFLLFYTREAMTSLTAGSQGSQESCELAQYLAAAEQRVNDLEK